MNLKPSITGVALSLLPALVLAQFKDSSAMSFVEAKANWTKNHERAEFKEYMAQFIEQNNKQKLDEKDDCYSKSQGAVEMLLVITKKSAIEAVLTNTNTPRAACFRASYKGIEVGSPPYSPLIIRLEME